MSSDDYTHDSSITSLLTEHGRKPFQPKPSEYVLHTSTIPLATTLDLQFARKKTRNTKLISLFHGDVYDKDGEVCGKRSCMYLKYDRTRTNEKILSNCPCTEVTTIDGKGLNPICFLSYLKSLNRNLVDTIDEDAYRIEPSRIMFCQDSQGIFDNQYPGSIRDKVGVTGWGHVSPHNYLDVMDCLFWYRKGKKKYELDKIMQKAIKEKGFIGMKRALKQTLHTLNGLLSKKFIVFGPEIADYMKIAEQTARLFKDLFHEYLVASLEDLPSNMENSSVYLEMKDLFNHCKQFFYKSDDSVRTSWLSWQFKNRSLGAFWGHEFRGLLRYARSKTVCETNSYTHSLAWIFRCTTFSQTRNLGYLPPHAAEVKFRAFRQVISRPLEPLEPEVDRMIRMAVRERFREAEISQGFLSNPQTEDEKYLAKEIFGNVNLDLKGTASLDHAVLEGGKLEDARVAIRLIIDNKWDVPVRNLHDNTIVDYMRGFEETDADSDWNTLLFWFSYQLTLNWHAQRRLVKDDLYWGFVLKTGKHYSFDILESSIVHIMEPGKVRNLVKGTGIVAWFLTPAAKILQKTLAQFPEHRAGLELSAHDWIHTRRISAESDESGFIYDNTTGRRKSNIVQIFKDWTESTDFISKRVGIAHLGSMMGYIGFPAAYGTLVLSTIREPQKVNEVIFHRYETEGRDTGSFDTERVKWSGQIVEGFMMGMPVTKVILHLMHVSERMIAKFYLERQGIEITDGDKAPRPLSQKVVIPRTKVGGKTIGIPTIMSNR